MRVFLWCRLQELVYDLYGPKEANADNKVFFVIVVFGFQRSKEALSNIAFELSRRGLAIVLIDFYAQDMSSSSVSRLAVTTQGYGMFALGKSVAGNTGTQCLPVREDDYEI